MAYLFWAVRTFIAPLSVVDHAPMAVLNFTLSEEGVSAFRDALICLSKFSDDVSFEARKDSVSHSLDHISSQEFRATYQA